MNEIWTNCEQISIVTNRTPKHKAVLCTIYYTCLIGLLTGIMADNKQVVTLCKVAKMYEIQVTIQKCFNTVLLYYFIHFHTLQR